MRPFRFGVVLRNATSGSTWAETVRKAEALGYATVLVPDHFGEQLAPFPALTAAAMATSTLRVGTFVCANDFHHPAMLAKEAATLDLLSDGRLELGLGAGWLRAEYEQAGLSFEPGPMRVDRLRESVRILKSLFQTGPATVRGRHYVVSGLDGFPKPVQNPHPPILVGGGGRRVLSIAAREADIVGLTPRAKVDGSGLDVTDITAAAVADKVRWVREAAPERVSSLELNVLVQAVDVTDDHRRTTEEVARRWSTTLEVVRESPFVLVGSPSHVAEQLQARREQYGISYVAIFPAHLENFAPVVARLSGT